MKEVPNIQEMLSELTITNNAALHCGILLVNELGSGYVNSGNRSTLIGAKRFI